jgi:hypothetical protein
LPFSARKRITKRRSRASEPDVRGRSVGTTAPARSWWGSISSPVRVSEAAPASLPIARVRPRTSRVCRERVRGGREEARLPHVPPLPVFLLYRRVKPGRRAMFTSATRTRARSVTRAESYPPVGRVARTRGGVRSVCLEGTRPPGHSWALNELARKANPPRRTCRRSRCYGERCMTRPCDAAWRARLRARCEARVRDG